MDKEVTEAQRWPDLSQTHATQASETSVSGSLPLFSGHSVRSDCPEVLFSSYKKSRAGEVAQRVKCLMSGHEGLIWILQPLGGS